MPFGLKLMMALESGRRREMNEVGIAHAVIGNHFVPLAIGITACARGTLGRLILPETLYFRSAVKRATVPCRGVDLHGGATVCLKQVMSAREALAAQRGPAGPDFPQAPASTDEDVTTSRSSALFPWSRLRLRSSWSTVARRAPMNPSTGAHPKARSRVCPIDLAALPQS